MLRDLPVYLAGVKKYGKEVKPLPLVKPQGARAWVREKINGKDWFVYYLRLKQKKDTAFNIDLDLPVRGRFMDLTPVGGKTVTVEAKKDDKYDRAEHIRLKIPADGKLDYVVRLRCQKDFAVPMPLIKTAGIKEIHKSDFYQQVNGGPSYWFNIPEGTEKIQCRYDGGKYIANVKVFNSSGKTVFDTTFNSANGGGTAIIPAAGNLKNWSYKVTGARGRGLARMEIRALPANKKLWFGASPEMLFVPEDF
jgi:hypothetical protein